MILVLLYHIVLYCIFFAPNGKFIFFSIFIIECFCTRLMTPDEVETGRGLLIQYNRLLYGIVWCW